MRPDGIWLASLLAFPLAGAPLLSHPAYRRWGLPARFALAAATGMFAVSTTMTFWTLARGTWRLPLLVAAGFVECLALRFATGGSAAGAAGLREWKAAAREPLSAGGRLALACIGVSLLAAGFATLATSATSTDLVLFWGPKSAVFAAARQIDAEFLADHLHRYLHASYPPLVPNAFAFATIASGGFSWMSAVATFPVLLVLLAAALPGVLRGSSDRRNALVGAAAVVTCLALAGTELQMAGNADPFLLFFETLALAVLLDADADDRAAQLVGGLLLGGAAAAKVEGLPFVLCAAVFYVLLRGRAHAAAPRGRRWIWSAATLFRLLAPTALALGAWFAFGRQRAVFLSYESYGPLLEVHWETLPHVLATIGRSMRYVAWGLPWLVPLAAWAVASARPSRGSTGSASARADRLYPAAIAAVLSLFFVFTYLHGGDPTFWIEWSAGRIFFVVSPLLAIGAISGSGSPAPVAATPGAPPRREATPG